MNKTAISEAQEIAAESVIAYIGLGSNLEQPAEQISAARNNIIAHPAITEVAFSSLYQSPPMGPQDQPDYTNAVMSIHTTLPPLELLSYLQSIENYQGRVRQAQRWIARTLDLDILLYNEQSINLPTLTIPHPGMAERAFVLYPLQEIAPTIAIPGLGALADVVANCPLDGLQRID